MALTGKTRPASFSIPKGNIFGTTSGGGGFGIGDQYTNSWTGGGTAFELTPGGAGKPWNEILTFLFPTCYSNPSAGESCGSDTQPESRLIWDSSGNLYGTTQIGGAISYCNDQKGIYLIGCGAVFQLVPPATSGGAWTQNVLYQFGGGSFIDGQFPLAALAFDTREICTEPLRPEDQIRWAPSSNSLPPAPMVQPGPKLFSITSLAAVTARLLRRV